MNEKRRIYSYEDIDKLVRRYKQGDEEAIAELLAAFEGFIVKYANFIKYGYMSKGDWDIQGLVKMLRPKIPSSMRMKMLRGEISMPPDRLDIIRDAMQSYEYEDIIGELNVMFMESALQFKKRKDGPTFAGFLYSYFKYTVKRWIVLRLRDALNVANIATLTEREDNMQMLEDTQEFENQFSRAKPHLDSVTRWILHLYYCKGYTDTQIAKIASVTSKWVCMQRRQAIKRMRELGVNKVEELLALHTYRTQRPL
jgi:RNA polymerase sigma factor (sigma-70 family)